MVGLRLAGSRLPSPMVMGKGTQNHEVPGRLFWVCLSGAYGACGAGCVRICCTGAPWRGRGRAGPGARTRFWCPGRIVPERTRLRGHQNRTIMRKPTDTPGAGARTILPGHQNRVRAPGPTRPRPRRGAPVQQIRTHPAPQAPYTPLRHTQNNLPGVTVPGVTGRQARGAEPQAEVMTVGRGHMSAGRGHGGEWSGPASSPWRPGTRSGVMAALGTTPTGSGAARIGPR